MLAFFFLVLKIYDTFCTHKIPFFDISFQYTFGKIFKGGLNDKKIDNKGYSEDEIFASEADLIDDANLYYQEHWCEISNFDINHTIITFEKAKELFEIEDYTIKII